MQVAQRPPGISEPLPNVGPVGLSGYRQRTRLGQQLTTSWLNDLVSEEGGTYSMRSGLAFLLSARIAGSVSFLLRRHGSADQECH